jgi:hypothetical protein
MAEPYIILYFVGGDGTRRYIVIRNNSIFENEKEAIAYRDKLNAEWKKDQQWRDRIKSLAKTYREEQK